MSDFPKWLQAQIDARGWTGAEVARRSGVTRQQIGRILSGENQPGRDSLEGIARAFGMPLETVMREAGFLPESGELLPELHDWNRRLRTMPPDRRQEAIHAMDVVLRTLESAFHAPGKR